MTSAIIGGLTPGQQNADARVSATPEQQKVAREFEAIFMRQLLSTMEKSSGFSGTGAGAGVYRSMLVGALADSATEGGGIGLADLVLQAMLRAQGTPAGAQPDESAPSDLERAAVPAPGTGENVTKHDTSVPESDGTQ